MMSKYALALQGSILEMTFFACPSLSIRFAQIAFTSLQLSLFHVEVGQSVLELTLLYAIHAIQPLCL